MLSLQWNALQVGDRVLVHDDTDISLRLQPGIVAMVQTARGSNDLVCASSVDPARSVSFGRAVCRSISILGM